MTQQGQNPRGQDTEKRVLQFDFSIELFARNYRELRQENRWFQHEFMREVGFLLHNFVAAAQSLVDHSRVAYRHLYEPEGLIPEYQNEINRRFVSDPLSQFVIGLRQMAQHYRLPSIGFVSTLEGGSIDMQLLLFKEDLHSYSGWNATAKRYLDTSGNQLDIARIARDYYDDVIAFYEWFRKEQKSVHGGGLTSFAHLTKYGLHTRADQILAQVSANLTLLKEQPWEGLTYKIVSDALAPALTLLDQRILMLCQYDSRVWLAEALSSIESRFTISAELRTHIEAVLTRAAQ